MPLGIRSVKKNISEPIIVSESLHLIIRESIGDPNTIYNNFNGDGAAKLTEKTIHSTYFTVFLGNQRWHMLASKKDRNKNLRQTSRAVPLASMKEELANCQKPQQQLSFSGC